jgi:two-component system, chemotaxis family, protein-glutamate methylesterase/glutaminase
VSQRLIVIGGSAGGLDALRPIVAALPPDLPVPVLAVLHLSPDAESMLPQILERCGPLPVRAATHGEPLTPGRITVARPNRHLVVHDDLVHLSRGPRENRHRPAVDALFTSAARWHGPGVIGVVLSGALDDGAAGAAAIAAQDGLVVVQDPAEASVSGMPIAALRAVRRARQVRTEEIGPLLVELARAPTSSTSDAGDEMMTWETANVDHTPVENRPPPPGAPAALGCPECQGGMFEARTGGRLHYLCHVGHSWSPATLLAAQRETTESALYNAASKLLEEASVLRQLAAEPGESEEPGTEADYMRRAEEAEALAQAIQNMIRDTG